MFMDCNRERSDKRYSVSSPERGVDKANSTL
jgi:hypothetical protein